MVNIPQCNIVPEMQKGKTKQKIVIKAVSLITVIANGCHAMLLSRYASSLVGKALREDQSYGFIGDRKAWKKSSLLAL